MDKAVVTQKYGQNPQIYKRFGLPYHNGVDFRTRFIDSPLGRRYVTASADGVVESVRYDVGGYGIHVRIRHADGSLTIYSHFTKPYVSKNQQVKAKQLIGLSGNTGFSSAPHLHWEYRIPGWEKMGASEAFGAVNPLRFVFEQHLISFV